MLIVLDKLMTFSVSQGLIPGIFIIELDFPHHRSVVPVTEYYQREPIINVPPQLSDFFWEILFLTVNHQ